MMALTFHFSISETWSWHSWC